MLFCENGYLSGEKAITDNLEKILQKEYAVKENTDDTERTQKISICKAISVGVVNGLNPCAASMLLMVLSILMVTGKKMCIRDRHNDLNVQSCYWPAYKTGNVNLVRPYVRCV